jgi:hypothetical protein
VTWEDLKYDCTSNELYLADDAGEELSLEYELDDEDRVVWWLQEDATDDVKLFESGNAQYKGKTYTPHAPAPLRYRALTAAGAFDSPYDRGEEKRVHWYTDWKGDLGRRQPRLGRTTELGQDTWFWMTPVAAPLLGSSLEFAAARRRAWGRRNTLTIIGTLCALAVAIVVHLATSAGASHQMSYDSGMLVSPSQRHWLSDPFELSGRTANVKAEVRVRNLTEWFDTTLCLANLDTHRRYCILVELDRGSSSHSDGFRDAAYFSAVPSGRYVLEGQAEADVGSPVEFQVQLVRDARRSNTFLTALAVLLGAPVLVALIAFGREQLADQDPGDVIQVVIWMLAIALIVWLDWMS